MGNSAIKQIQSQITVTSHRLVRVEPAGLGIRSESEFRGDEF